MNLFVLPCPVWALAQTLPMPIAHWHKPYSYYMTMALRVHHEYSPQMYSRGARSTTGGWCFKTGLALVCVYTLGAITMMLSRGSGEDGQEAALSLRGNDDAQKLAVVVPIIGGEAARAMVALSKWPDTCHGSTARNMDLVIYQAEALDDGSDLLSRIPRRASRCFRATKVISGNLLDEVGRRPGLTKFALFFTSSNTSRQIKCFYDSVRS